MKLFFLLFVVSLAIILEGFLTPLPFVLIVLFVTYVFLGGRMVLGTAFLSGIVLDVATVETLGYHSLYFLFFLFIVMLYERKFEVMTFPFFFFASFFGASVYLWLFGEHEILFSSLVVSILSVGVLYMLWLPQRKRQKEGLL